MVPKSDWLESGKSDTLNQRMFTVGREREKDREHVSEFTAAALAKSLTVQFVSFQITVLSKFLTKRGIKVSFLPPNTGCVCEMFAHSYHALLCS